jgi:HEXXH motif-containing protein
VVVNSATVRAVKPHVLSRSDFFALAEGRGSKDFIEFLWSAERSRRLLLIKSLLDNAERNPGLLGPLPSAHSAWSALARAQRAQPTAADPVLLHPQVGTALSCALRRLASGDGRPRTDSLSDNADAAGTMRPVGPDQRGAPLWVDFGQVHTICLVVAARASLAWRTEVPLRNGTAMLPGLGMVRFPHAERWGRARARTEGGRIWLAYRGDEVRVPADAGTDLPHWLGLRQLTIGEEPTLTVWLDDLDPFRDFADPVPPERLDEQGRQCWHDLLAEAWKVICGDQPELAACIAAGVRSVVPLPDVEGWDNRSASTGEAFGSIMLSPPSDATSLAVSLVHEFQHIKLGGLMHLLTLTADDEAPTLYAPWRDDPRPLGGLIQGAYAFLGIATFWRSHRKNLAGPMAQLATFEYAYAREQTHEALSILFASEILTPIGREFVDGMHEHLVSWLDDEISPNVMELVCMVADGHRAGWRIRHLRPREADVSTLAKAWLDGTNPPPAGASHVVPHLDRNWSRGRLGLVRRRVVSPDRFGEAVNTAPWAANMIKWDVALMAGEFVAARDGYLGHIRADPANLDAWSGLGLALQAAGLTEASATLLGRPELVLAVDEALRAAGQVPPPVELASWLGAVATTDWPHARSCG